MFRRKEKASIFRPQAVTNTLLMRLLDAMSFEAPIEHAGRIFATKNSVDYSFHIDENESIISISTWFWMLPPDSMFDALQKVNHFNQSRFVVRASIHLPDSDPKDPTIWFMSDMHFTKGLAPRNLLHRLLAFEAVVVMTDHPIRALMLVAK